METEKLYKLATDNGITLDFYHMPKTVSAAINLSGRYFVAIDPDVTGDTALERVCLAHELGHCQTGSLYNIYSPHDVRAKHERRADKWAADMLISQKGLKKAVKNGYCDISALAEYFSVTEDFMKKAIELYRE